MLQPPGKQTMPSGSKSHIESSYLAAWWRHSVLRRLLKDPAGLIGSIIVLALVILALAAPWITPNDPIALNLKERLSPPSTAYPLGTDDFGRDVLTRLAYGARISLQSAVMVQVLATVVGCVVGIVGGYRGGAVDETLMRLTDIFLAFPFLIMGMAVNAVLGAGLSSAVLALASVWWPGYARLARSQVLVVRNELYVEAARAVGVTQLGIMVKHILPNVFGVVLVKMMMDIGGAILSLASLSFIGLGAQAPSPEWGVMVQEGRKVLLEAWWVCTFSGGAILLAVMGFNLLGDGLSEAADPFLRER